MTEHDHGNDLEKISKPNFFLTNLNVFVGKWRTEGIVKDRTSGSTIRLRATDTYEWLPGGFFLIHHVDGHIGVAEVKAIEIIGFDEASQMYFTHSFDNQGSRGNYQANLLDAVWTITGTSERFSGIFSDNFNTLSGRWELLNESSEWEHWMDITLTRIVS
ncbi:DUF1579 family protein [Paenibacillus arenosi]|uniref:DUF1579 family protein n=1 Tax=Paenibacillus arenosi TaxID=2774142 RepID=A0ABR9AYA4_9BACL|nr:DUF1579 family protein [Paenibacillus arenosi]